MVEGEGQVQGKLIVAQPINTEEEKRGLPPGCWGMDAPCSKSLANVNYTSFSSVHSAVAKNDRHAGAIYKFRLQVPTRRK